METVGGRQPGAELPAAGLFHASALGMDPRLRRKFHVPRGDSKAESERPLTLGRLPQ